jgi:hypothetical protein
MTCMDSNSPRFFLENKERIEFEIKKYPNVVSVGVGLKEINDQITSTLCYRVYVREKKDSNSLKDHERIPSIIDGFQTDVIPYGVIEEIADIKHYRPLKGGIQIKNDSYVDEDKRGAGTLGCLALFSDEETTDEIVGLTCDHVVFLNTQISDEPSLGSGKIGQPQKVICCCCCVKNIVGEVLSSLKDSGHDCAIFALHSDIVKEIRAKGTLREIQDVGSIKGKALPETGALVKKRGAATGLTRGTIVDIAFDNSQILIAPEPPSGKFADFGDSGAIVLDKDNLVIGLLWGAKRDRFTAGGPNFPAEDPRSTHNQTHALKPRVHGVATPIAAVEEALSIKIPVPPPEIPTISIHESDTNTHVVPSILPALEKPKQHFVTIRGEGDIVLKVTFDQPVANGRIGWTSDSATIIFPAVPGDNSTARISRAGSTGSRSEVGVTVDGEPAGDKVVVWIIWSTITNLDFEVDPNFEVKTEETEIKTRKVCRFEFKFQPQEIFPVTADDDVPDLKGTNTVPPPSVPNPETGVFNHGVDLSDDAKFKWDATIALRYTMKNTFGFIMGPHIPFGRPFPDYPSSNIVGNFETSSDDALELDPYATDFPNFRGKIIRTFVIIHALPHSIVAAHTAGQTLEMLLNYKVFARLELNGAWHPISDFKLEGIKLKYVVGDEFKDRTDYNQDGDKLDMVWLGKLASDGGGCFHFFGNTDDF